MILCIICLLSFFTFLQLPAQETRHDNVEKFLSGVYDRVAETANNGKMDYEILLNEYCSAYFCELYTETRRWEEKTKETVIGFGSGAYDILVGCHDYFEKVCFKVSGVHKVSDSEPGKYRARVTARFYCSEYDEKEWQAENEVDVVFENGKWQISDFFSMDGGSFMSQMRKALPVIVNGYFSHEVEAEFVSSRLERIYKEVAKYADSERFDTSLLSEKYFSRRFKELNDEMNYWEGKSGVMIAGIDCWIRSQEWDSVRYEISNVRVVSPSRSLADIVAIYTIGEKLCQGKTLVGLVFEDGEWMIDDFTDYNPAGELYGFSDSEVFSKGVVEAVEMWMDINGK